MNDKTKELGVSISYQLFFAWMALFLLDLTNYFDIKSIINLNLFALVILVFYTISNFSREKTKTETNTLTFLFILMILLISINSILEFDIFFGYSFVAFLILISLSTLVLKRIDIKKRKEEFVKHEKVLHISFIVLILIAIIAYSMLIRIQYFWTDEVFSLFAAKTILQTGSPLLEGGLYYDRAIFYHYLLAGAIFLFGDNEFGARILNVLFALGTSLLVFYILRKNTNLHFAIYGSIFLLFNNLFLNMVMEARMYAMFTFFFLLLAVTYTKTFLEVNNKTTHWKLPIINLKIHFNWNWLGLLIIVALVSYNTQLLATTFLLSVIIYHLILAMKKDESYKNAFYFIVFLLLLFAGSFVKYGTVDLAQIYVEETNLTWSEEYDRNPSYYIDLLENNVLFFSAILGINLGILLLTNNRTFILYYGTMLAPLAFLSFQKALKERYFYFLLPIFVILLTISLYKLFKQKNKYIKHLGIALMVFLLGFNSYLFYNEIKYIDDYKNAEINRERKFQYNSVLDYLNNDINLDNYQIVTDWHSTATLLAYGIRSDYTIVEKNSYKLLDGRSDEYFGIEYLESGSPSFYGAIKSEDTIFIMRTYYKYPNQKDFGKRIEGFDLPGVFIRETND